MTTEEFFETLELIDSTFDDGVKVLNEVKHTSSSDLRREFMMSNFPRPVTVGDWVEIRKEGKWFTSAKVTSTRFQVQYSIHKKEVYCCWKITGQSLKKDGTERKKPQSVTFFVEKEDTIIQLLKQ